MVWERGSNHSPRPASLRFPFPIHFTEEIRARFPRALLLGVAGDFARDSPRYIKIVSHHVMLCCQRLIQSSGPPEMQSLTLQISATVVWPNHASGRAVRLGKNPMRIGSGLLIILLGECLQFAVRVCIKGFGTVYRCHDLLFFAKASQRRRSLVNSILQRFDTL